MNCMVCGTELARINGNSRYYTYLCDNWRCPIYRYPQSYEERVLPITGAKPNPRRLRGSYMHYLEQRKENYRRLRQMGIPPLQAARMTSNRQTRLALEAVPPSP